MLPHYRLRTAGVQLSVAGRVEAEDEVALAFRIPDRLIENSCKLGDLVQPEQVLAKLESQNESNALRQAQAGLAAAGPNDPGAQSFRPSGDAAWSGVDHPRQFRDGYRVAHRSSVGRRGEFVSTFRSMSSCQTIFSPNR